MDSVAKVADFMKGGEELLAKILRNTSDIDHAHDRIRALQTDIDISKSRIGQIENRLVIAESKNATLEERVLEDRELLTELKHEVMLLKKTSDHMLEMVARTMTSSEKTCDMLKSHIHDEAEQILRQTRGIESVSRRVIVVITAISALVVILAAIHQHLTGSSVFSSVAALVIKMVGG